VVAGEGAASHLPGLLALQREAAVQAQPVAGVARLPCLKGQVCCFRKARSLWLRKDHVTLGPGLGAEHCWIAGVEASRHGPGHSRFPSSLAAGHPHVRHGRKSYRDLCCVLLGDWLVLIQLGLQLQEGRRRCHFGRGCALCFFGVDDLGGEVAVMV
jgi:hypothetical protein